MSVLQKATIDLLHYNYSTLLWLIRRLCIMMSALDETIELVLSNYKTC